MTKIRLRLACRGVGIGSFGGFPLIAESNNPCPTACPTQTAIRKGASPSRLTLPHL